MGHEFLSTSWIAEVRAIHDKYTDILPQLTIPQLRINIQITDIPEGVGEAGTLVAHADLSRPRPVLDFGPLADPDLTVTVDYDTAYELLVAQRPNAAVGALLTGRSRLGQRPPRRHLPCGGHQVTAARAQR